MGIIDRLAEAANKGKLDTFSPETRQFNLLCGEAIYDRTKEKSAELDDQLFEMQSEVHAVLNSDIVPARDKKIHRKRIHEVHEELVKTNQKAGKLKGILEQISLSGTENCRHTSF